MLDHALAWAARGFRVFPLHPDTRHPVWKAWYDYATTDAGWIESIWAERDYNIGVLTDGRIVVDVDVKRGKAGMASALDLGLPFDTLTVQTPSGGLHLYYDGPDVANSAGKLAEGIDIRSHHGFVIAPGSVINGQPYKLLRDSPTVSFPVELIAKCGQPRERAAALDVQLDDPGAVTYATAWLGDQDGAVWGQGGDEYTYKIACKLRDFGLSEETTFSLLAGSWNDRCQPNPWPLDQLRLKVANAYAYATGAAGRDSPIRQFEGVHVEPDTARPSGHWFYHLDDHRGSVQWLYDEVLPTTGVTILSAPSGAGKTFIALYLAQSLATGDPFFKVNPSSTGGTMILVGEAFGSIKMRLAALGGGQERLPIAARYVGGLAAQGAWKALCEDIRATAVSMHERFGKPVRLIVLDTLSASNILEREEDNAQAAYVMKLFGELAISLNVLFLVVHHPPKSGEGERGAGAIRNNADYVLTVVQRPHEQLREIEITKSRDGECRALGTFTLTPVDIDGGRTMIVQAGEPRIKPAHSGPPKEHVELIGQAVDFALKTTGQNIQWEGNTWADEESVFAQFKDGWRGIRRDKAVVHPKFKAALAFAINLGAVEAMEHDGVTYYRERDLL